ncbi:o-Glycosyl hydrolase family 30 domain-containing protein [Neofusicoccum parvum]|uniref:O-Glycosyl hydrolase family 30 domain-containing protein n=1 Tax=Neofusicoccum parvum TaxID=310453 RepID=A0ACB5SLU0_9PEZI|nr:o-Glycosyl hydrolase family 30 domain-containing protein [Neofusicoccum parvum]
MQISTNAQEAISFIPTLSDTVKKAGLDTNITCCDAMGWSQQTQYTAAMKSAGMENYLDVITSHTYSSEATSAIDTNLPTWVTESGTGSASAFITTWYSSGAAGEGFTWATKIAKGIVDANLSAYLYWEGFEVGQTQSGSHLVDSTGSEATPSGIFWAFAMWSRFIRPGAYRLQTTGSPSGVITGAFKNTDGSVITVFTNTGSSTQSAKVAFNGFTPKTANAYLMDNSHQVASTSAQLSGSAVTVSIPSKGVVTVKLA